MTLAKSGGGWFLSKSLNLESACIAIECHMALCLAAHAMCPGCDWDSMNFCFSCQSSLSPNHSQGTLHGQQDKVPCGIQWLCRQIPGSMICLRTTPLLILLKSYGLIPIDSLKFLH